MMELENISLKIPTHFVRECSLRSGERVNPIIHE